MKIIATASLSIGIATLCPVSTALAEPPNYSFVEPITALYYATEVPAGDAYKCSWLKRAKAECEPEGKPTKRKCGPFSVDHASPCDSDPALGDPNKVALITYKCVFPPDPDKKKAENAIWITQFQAEHGALTPNCEGQDTLPENAPVIKIKSAEYSGCGKKVDILNWTRDVCDHRTRCVFTVNNGMAGDPAKGCEHKHAVVVWNCVAQTQFDKPPQGLKDNPGQFEEHNATDITCE